jgi:hypothetical protein
MSETTIHGGQCPNGQGDTPHPERELHRQMQGLLSRLDAQQRRWSTALEANRCGHGGEQLMSHMTGLDPHTIRRGRPELVLARCARPAERVRARGAGRPRTDKKPGCSQRCCAIWSRPTQPVIRCASTSGYAVACVRCVRSWAKPATTRARPRAVDG